MERLFETKYGYFTPDGNEYVIKRHDTPKPWINVISNGDYGLTISQAGGGFSWLTHSEFNRVNRWHQDLIQDNWGKYIYFKNNETGEVWAPAFLPVKTPLDYYECRHGFGYTVLTSEFKGIRVEMTLFVPMNDTLEIWDLKIKNNTGKRVSLSVFTYFEWCLGSSSDFHREFHKTFIETGFNEEGNYMHGTKRLWEIPLGDRGHWNIDYQYHGFFSVNKKVVSFESDKSNFIGQYGDLISPAALKGEPLKRKTGAWSDPIGCLQNEITIETGGEETLIYQLGLVKELEEIAPKLSNYNTSEKVAEKLAEVKAMWSETLSTLEVQTPDDAMNLLVNKWLRYQAISGRLWGRTAYYQQSGAFGFRDQLQDSLVWLPIDPKGTEKQIKLHAEHQFVEGTVLHWWHPITETGLVTKMTDDLLWLPYILSLYIKETGNLSFADEEVGYYDNKNLKESLYEHSLRAIDVVFSRLSPRGIPLIGAGDWNDGLSAVGLEFKGESVWMAEFFYLVLTEFAELATRKKDDARHARLLSGAEKIKTAFNAHAWDGEYYYRGTKDTGEKFGSSENEQGSIFLNPQTWSVLSDIAPKEKQEAALQAVKKYLLKKNGTVLLTPAYSTPDKYIGYLSRYAPGRRENGGVYMHAATWAIWAFAKAGDPETAFEVYKGISPIFNGMEPDLWSAEPFVTPGNIDGPDSPDYGRAGWSWYTGSASWYQKVIVDWILGVRASEGGLLIDPSIPADWEGFTVKRLFRGCIYNITVKNPQKVASGVAKVTVDGSEIQGNLIAPSSNKEVQVEVIMGTG
ncbi:MAG: Cellobiose phosphorylase [Ignavibacteriaceae bacterium]|nr:Cellobiose phosphorylase [Ignavibacteriaceae bacterium]WKZ71425.1 MAG: glycosyl transferase family 36 [Ignavibacteriaceae bacterium]